MFIFIYTFPSQDSLCVDIELLFNIHLSNVSVAELIVLGGDTKIAGGAYCETLRWLGSG